MGNMAENVTFCQAVGPEKVMLSHEIWLICRNFGKSKIALRCVRNGISYWLLLSAKMDFTIFAFYLLICCISLTVFGKMRSTAHTPVKTEERPRYAQQLGSVDVLVRWLYSNCFDAINLLQVCHKTCPLTNEFTHFLAIYIIIVLSFHFPSRENILIYSEFLKFNINLLSVESVWRIS